MRQEHNALLVSALFITNIWATLGEYDAPNFLLYLYIYIYKNGIELEYEIDIRHKF